MPDRRASSALSEVQPRLGHRANRSPRGDRPDMTRAEEDRTPAASPCSAIAPPSQPPPPIMPIVSVKLASPVKTVSDGGSPLRQKFSHGGQAIFSRSTRFRLPYRPRPSALAWYVALNRDVAARRAMH